MTYPNAKEVMERALRDELNRLLGLCTEIQQTAFHKMSGDISELSGIALSAAYGLVVRTLQKNEKEVVCFS